MFQGVVLVELIVWNRILDRNEVLKKIYIQRHFVQVQERTISAHDNLGGKTTEERLDHDSCIMFCIFV